MGNLTVKTENPQKHSVLKAILSPLNRLLIKMKSHCSANLIESSNLSIFNLGTVGIATFKLAYLFILSNKVYDILLLYGHFQSTTTAMHHSYSEIVRILTHKQYTFKSVLVITIGNACPCYHFHLDAIQSVISIYKYTGLVKLQLTRPLRIFVAHAFVVAEYVTFTFYLPCRKPANKFDGL